MSPQTKCLIAVDEFCANHNIEVSFVDSLQQTGLIKILNVEESSYIHTDQLQQLEIIVRFYYEFGINLEGIEAITYLIQRINALLGENLVLSNRLRLYE